MLTAAKYCAAREHHARKQAELARSRPGVVDLAEWRSVSRARGALEGLVGGAPWFRRTRVAHAERGLVIQVDLVYRAAEAPSCIPNSVNYVPVKVALTP